MNMNSIVLVASFLSGTLGLTFVPNGVNDDTCGATHRYDARAKIKARDWSGLKGNPCLNEEEVQSFEDGIEDPADMDEFLGEDKAMALAKNKATGCTKTKWPSLLYFGMGHSGSTTVSELMNKHPQMSYGVVKEHRFNWKHDSRHLKDYQNEFKVGCDTKVAFDATIGYIWRAKPKIELIKAALDKKKAHDSTKFMAMFRDPVHFIHSSHPDKKLNGESNKGSTKHGPLKSGSKQYMKAACYANYIEDWIGTFGRERFLFMRSEDFFNHPQEVLDKVFKFNNVEPKKYSQKQLAPDAAAGRRRSSPVSLKLWRDYHDRPEATACRTRLEQLTGLNFTEVWKPPSY